VPLAVIQAAATAAVVVEVVVVVVVMVVVVVVVTEARKIMQPYLEQSIKHKCIIKSANNNNNNKYLPASYPVITRAPFPGSKWAGSEADHLPSNAKS
jgi:hypothetical protein